MPTDYNNLAEIPEMFVPSKVLLTVTICSLVGQSNNLISTICKTDANLIDQNISREICFSLDLDEILANLQLIINDMAYYIQQN